MGNQLAGLEILMPPTVVSRAALIQAIWNWDPIGVAEHRPDVEGEYDDLASSILTALDAGRSLPDVADIIYRYIADLDVQPAGLDQFLVWLRDAVSSNRDHP